MTEGTVKFFNGAKNYGFINGDDGKAYFVHGSGLKEGVSIGEGDRVSFKVVEGDKGPKAEEVEKLEAKKE
jgi:CspA family cold shock protein